MKQQFFYRHIFFFLFDDVVESSRFRTYVVRVRARGCGPPVAHGPFRLIDSPADAMAASNMLGIVPRYTVILGKRCVRPLEVTIRTRQFVPSHTAAGLITPRLPIFSSTIGPPTRTRTTNRRMSGTTSGHYESHTADSYESAYFYSAGEYTDYLRDTVKRALHLPASASTSSSTLTNKKKDRRLIDIGGGTGNFTRMILEGVPNVEGVVIDPFLEAGSTDTGSDGGGVDDIRFVKASAEDFAATESTTSTSTDSEWWKSGYHCILLKEVVHHLPYERRSDIFRGLRCGLADLDDGHNEVPSLLIVTRPQVEIDYPLWPAAREVWAANQPSASDIEADLRVAGFEHVESKTQTYPASIELDRWLDMVNSRFWSTFSKFSDEELKEACNLIRDEATNSSKVDDGGIVHFEDRLVFITAR